MEKKYILTDETTQINDHILHRIQAIRDFGYITAGTLGGWIESEDNLSHIGLCWVHRNAKVFGNAFVYNNATIYDYAEVYDYAYINSNAEILDHAKIYGYAGVTDRAIVRDQAIIAGSSGVCDNSIVSHDAIVSGNAMIMNGACIRRNGVILDTTNYLLVGPIGSRNDYTTFYRTENNIWVSCGCFNDLIDNFEKRVLKAYGEVGHGKKYLSAIRFAREYF